MPEVADPLSPITFVDKINVPVFMACQFTDEQTGGHCPTLAEHMTGTDKKWFTFTNGTHVDSLDPETYNSLYDFLKIYVGQQAPTPAHTAIIQASWPVGRCNRRDQQCTGQRTAGQTLPADTIQASRPRPRAVGFRSAAVVRVLFDNGAGNSSNPGWPYPAFEQSFSSFPIPAPPPAPGTWRPTVPSRTRPQPEPARTGSPGTPTRDH